MAVPKKKTSKSRRNQRRSHHNFKPVNVVKNESGSFSLPGHIALDGTYGGKKIISTKEEKLASKN